MSYKIKIICSNGIKLPWYKKQLMNKQKDTKLSYTKQEENDLKY